MDKGQTTGDLVIHQGKSIEGNNQCILRGECEAASIFCSS